MPTASGQTSRYILVGQIAVLLFCFSALISVIVNFPYPSYVAKPFLPPKLRWPTQQVMTWVEEGQFDRDFARYFARDPEREIPPGASIVSAADGIVQMIRQSGGTTYLVVGLSFWDVHVVRTPVSGTIKDVEMQGAYLERLAPEARRREQLFLQGKDAPVQAIITVATDFGDVKVRMITSYWASRLKVWIYPGQKVNMGDRIGRIVLGSTVVTEFPGTRNFDVKAGEHVLAGASKMASR